MRPNNGRTLTPQYTVGTCVLAAVMGAYFKVRAAVGDGQPRAEVPGSLSGDAKPPSADAQTLKAIDEGTWAVLKQLSMAGAPLCEWPGAVPGHDTVAAGWMEDGRNPLAALCPACLGKSKALLEAAIDEDGPRICAFAGCV